MANIDLELEKIKAAIYGRDVRDALYNGLSSINSESINTVSIANESKASSESAVNSMNNAINKFNSDEEIRKNNETERISTFNNLKNTLDTTISNGNSAVNDLTNSKNDLEIEINNLNNSSKLNALEQKVNDLIANGSGSSNGISEKVQVTNDNFKVKADGFYFVTGTINLTINTVNVTGLKQGEKFYFAIKSKDYQCNVSITGNGNINVPSGNIQALRGDLNGEMIVTFMLIDDKLMMDYDFNLGGINNTIGYLNSDVVDLKDKMSKVATVKFGDITLIKQLNGLRIFTGYVSCPNPGNNWIPVTLPSGGFADNNYKVTIQPILNGYDVDQGTTLGLMSDLKTNTVFTISASQNMKGFDFIAIGK